MKKAIILSLLIIATSCSHDEPEYFYGKAMVKVLEGNDSDSLTHCHCWQTKDSTAITIYTEGFSGIAIDIINKGGNFFYKMERYIDDFSFNGSNYRAIPINSKEMEITFQDNGSGLLIKGEIDVVSKDQIISGTFNCLIEKALLCKIE